MHINNKVKSAVVNCKRNGEIRKLTASRRSRLGQSKAFPITSQLKVSDFSSTSPVNALKAKRNCFGDRLKSSSEQPLFLFAIFFKENFQI